MKNEELKKESLGLEKVGGESLPELPENREEIKNGLELGSTKELDDFKLEGERNLSALGARADSSGLEILATDEEALRGISLEAEEAKNDLLKKLTEGEGGTENQGNETASKKEAREFSKRYSPFRRTEVAQQVVQLRAEVKQRKKELEAKNLEASGQREELGGELENIKARISRIEKVVTEFEASIQEQKGKICILCIIDLSAPLEMTKVLRHAIWCRAIFLPFFPAFHLAQTNH